MLRSRSWTAGLTLSVCVLAKAAHAAPPDATDVAPPPDEPAFDAPPPDGKGVIAGTVTEAGSAEPLIEAEVAVAGTKATALTDADGHYRLELPPGTYVLRITSDLEKPARLEGVHVVAGHVTAGDVALEPSHAAEDVIEVETQLDTTTVEGQLVARRKSAAVGDAVGRVDMVKADDKTAAEAAKRVVGATLEGSRFVFVRGLGERYTNALLDGAPLPSPEPDKQAIPLDLFPSQILDGVALVKTFTPDVPGDFAGGSVRINTRRFSDRWTAQLSASLGLNTQASFAKGIGYDGSPTDFLGFDSGGRALPSDMPDYRVGRTGKKPDGSFPTQDELTHYAREINSPMTAHERTTPPNFSMSGVLSKAWKFDHDRRFGFLAALTYDRRFEVRNDEILRTFTPNPIGEGVVPFDEAKVHRGIDRVVWGGLGGVTFEFDKSNRIALTGLYSRAADKEADEFLLTREGQGEKLDTRLSWVERGLAYGQLRGGHDFEKLGHATLEWSASLARATRDEPDRRGLVYGYDSSFGWQYADDPDSGSHFYARQGETSVGGVLDWTQPLAGSVDGPRLKVGGSMNLRNRDFDARRFRLKPQPKAPADARICPGASAPDPACVDAYLSDANMGTTVQIDEVSRLGDQYGAHLDVFAAYVMLDTPIGKHVRLIVGPRLEASYQGLSAVNPVNPTETRSSTLDEANVLPAASLVYSPTDEVNLRASLTRTIARPQLREIAPFSFSDYFAARPTEGNPDLVNTSIVNADLRFETFPAAGQVLAVSSFFKQFSNPIEQVVTPAGDNGLVTYQNAKGARLFGMEFEARQSFGIFHEVLSPLSLIANVTLAHSTVDLDPARAALVTNKSRALSLQAPYIVNLGLDWSKQEWGTSARVSYNVVGRRIAQVGLAGLPDIYQQPRHQLDFAVIQRVAPHVEVKAVVTNLVDSPVLFTQGESESDSGDNVTSRYTLGRTVSLGVSVFD